LGDMAFETHIENVPVLFETGPEVFSPGDVDQGTRLLLSNVKFDSNDKILDLGCGYGAMGIYAAKLLSPQQVHMIDSDPQALKYAARNARSNGVEGVHIELSDGFRQFRGSAFTQILCNPPYHCDFSVAKHFIEKGFNRLVVGGSMWMVTKREKWYRNKLTNVFGGAQVISRDTYFVFRAIKKHDTYASRAPQRR
jgi:16S rRNA (guanine1207-N2)-methyltransferase